MRRGTADVLVPCRLKSQKRTIVAPSVSKERCRMGDLWKQHLRTICATCMKFVDICRRTYALAIVTVLKRS